MTDESTGNPALPENVVDLADLTVCCFCGETYDASWADLSFFHSSNHTGAPLPFEANGIAAAWNGRRRRFRRFIDPLAAHVRRVRAFVIVAMIEEPRPKLHLVDPSRL